MTSKYPPIINAEDVQGAAAQLKGPIAGYSAHTIRHWTELRPADREISIAHGIKFVEDLQGILSAPGDYAAP